MIFGLLNQERVRVNIDIGFHTPRVTMDSPGWCVTWSWRHPVRQVGDLAKTNESCSEILKRRRCLKLDNYFILIIVL